MSFNIEYAIIFAIIIVNLAGLFFVKSSLTKYFINFFLVILSILFLSQIIFDIELLLKISLIYLALALLVNMLFDEFFAKKNQEQVSEIHKILTFIFIFLLFLLSASIFVNYDKNFANLTKISEVKINKFSMDKNLKNLAHNRQKKLDKIKANKILQIILPNFTLIIMIFAIFPLIVIRART